MSRLSVYDLDGDIHYYDNVHQIIDMSDVILVIYRDENEILKCVGHDKINISFLFITIQRG